MWIIEYKNNILKSNYDLARPLQGRRLQGVLRPPRLGAQPRHPVLRRANILNVDRHGAFSFSFPFNPHKNIFSDMGR